MRTISIGRTLDAEASAIWDVLADFPGISSWNSGVNTSRATSEATSGVGATRHCDLAPIGALEETIQEWDPGHRLVVSIDEAKRLPIRNARATFTMEPADGGTTVTIDYEYHAQLGVGPLLDRQLSKGFAGFLDDLEREAQRTGQRRSSNAR
jgi:uncharacterized protein YndB with AHSA1/START domain